MLNAVRYLFEREIARSIMLYCLDGFGADGICGKCGKLTPTAERLEKAGAGCLAAQITTMRPVTAAEGLTPAALCVLRQ